MIGLVYPGVNRLDYDYAFQGGVFPSHIESLNDARTARWLEMVLYLLPVEPRPPGYSPLGQKNLDPQWVARLGQSGRDCFEGLVWPVRDQFPAHLAASFLLAASARARTTSGRKAGGRVFT